VKGINNIQDRKVILEKNKYKTRNDVVKFIISKGYSTREENVSWPYEYKNLYQRRVKDFETESVCETNDKLFLNINEYKFHNIEPGYNVEIIAERSGLWWTLNSYNLKGNDVYVRLDEIEKKLIQFFNAI